MPDIFIDPPGRLADAAVTLPNFATAVRAVDSAIDAKTKKQAEIARRDDAEGGLGKAVYHALLAAKPADWHESLFRELAAEAILGDAARAKAKEGGRG